MPNETMNNMANSQVWLWSDKTLWSVVAMFVLGSMARTFISNSPFEPKKFIGEIIFAAIGAIVLYSAGLMQGMSEVQIVCFGSFASLGGVRTLEWIMKIGKAIKGMDGNG